MILNMQPEVTNLAVGIAAEHLVCAELLLLGYRAFMTDQNCPHDVAVELQGRMIRVQVKATRELRPILQYRTEHGAYQWHVRRNGKGGVRMYADDEFDLLALVALDIKRIAYLPPSQHKQTVHIRPHGTGGKQFDDFPFHLALKGLPL
jgi:hypothetical protein